MSPPINSRLSGQSSGPGQRSEVVSTVTVVLAILGCTMFAFCAGLGLLGAVFYSRMDAKSGRTAIQSFPAQPAPAPLVAPAWQTEWIAIAQLTPVYTAALDTVLENATILEKLGEPLEPGDDPENLFRRQKSGDWTGVDETIEFDLRGSKGAAVVRVTAGSNVRQPGAFYQGIGPKSITVILDDGTEIDVPPPQQKPESPEP